MTSSLIQSVQNPRFRHWMRIMKRGRLPNGEAVLPVEGPKLLAEALVGGWRPVLVACTPHGLKAGIIEVHDPAFAGAETLLLAPHVFQKLADTATPQEPFVLVKPPEGPGLWEPSGQAGREVQGSGKRRKLEKSDVLDESNWSDASDPSRRSNRLRQSGSLMSSSGTDAVAPFPPGISRLVVADGVQDPGNLGTILRSARAFGFDTVATTPGSAGVASAKVLRASAGALFRCRILPAVPMSELVRRLLDHGFLIVVLDPRGTVSIEEVEWREPVAIVCGGEAHGPSGVWAATGGDGPDASGELVRARIPMAPGCESLNTATAAALAFHAASRALSPF